MSGIATQVLPQGPESTIGDQILRIGLLLGSVPTMAALAWLFAWCASIVRQTLLRMLFPRMAATVEQARAGTGSAGGVGDCIGTFIRFSEDSARRWLANPGANRPLPGSKWVLYLLDATGQQAIAYPACSGFPVALVERSQQRQWFPREPLRLYADAK